jgi:hypothetical protein
VAHHEFVGSDEALHVDEIHAWIEFEFAAEGMR